MRFTENFERAKKEALMSLEIALRKGEVDEDIIPLLKKINSIENYFTTSSCSGRISVMEMPHFGDKVNAKWLGKWHREVSLYEVLEAIKKHRSGQLWFLVRSPILHVGAKTLEDAVKLVNLAVSCGFKYSNIKSISNKKLIVEIRSTERMDVLLGENGEIFVGEEYLNKIVEIANDQMRRFKEKLKRLESKINALNR
uniref:tRNA(Phe) 7-((3-amino-3-carboxypropyl)-4-demethylwyosine(37)-N(4))-methyltransferase 1 n=2 Tax=Pyrococcus horikoshii TaxID=53953 RepID=TYW31_PYRHO|nr:RecName: Full=tRNA(Phe) 7-((3-amino-3-carboxypropyl)-4-demethylwyosine(37)-N(4))-methyltransferase 1; AltName: Full=tRNA wyosine derivatives biosynthesis protein Taw3 1 [Pyrococcus horikoshii OT3]